MATPDTAVATMDPGNTTSTTSEANHHGQQQQQVHNSVPLTNKVVSDVHQSVGGGASSDANVNVTTSTNNKNHQFSPIHQLEKRTKHHQNQSNDDEDNLSSAANSIMLMEEEMLMMAEDNNNVDAGVATNGKDGTAAVAAIATATENDVSGKTTPTFHVGDDHATATTIPLTTPPTMAQRRYQQQPLLPLVPIAPLTKIVTPAQGQGSVASETKANHEVIANVDIAPAATRPVPLAVAATAPSMKKLSFPAPIVKERETTSLDGPLSLEEEAIDRLHRRILSLPESKSSASTTRAVAGNGCICVLQKSQEARLLLDAQTSPAITAQNKNSAGTPASQASVLQVNELLPFATLLEKMTTATAPTTANSKATATPILSPQACASASVNRVLISCDSPQLAERWNAAFQALHIIMGSPDENAENAATASTNRNGTLPSWVANLGDLGDPENKEVGLDKELDALHNSNTASSRKVVIVTHDICKSNFSELYKAFGRPPVDSEDVNAPEDKNICDLVILSNAVGSSSMSALMDHTDSTRSALYGIPCQRRMVVLLTEEHHNKGDFLPSASSAPKTAADRGMKLLLLLCSYLHQKTNGDEDGDGDDDDSTTSNEDNHLALLKRFYAMVEICHCPSTILALMGRLDLFMGACQERLQTANNNEVDAVAAAGINRSASASTKHWLPHVLESDIGRQLALVVQRIVIPFFDLDLDTAAPKGASAARSASAQLVAEYANAVASRNSKSKSILQQVAQEQERQRQLQFQAQQQQYMQQHAAASAATQGQAPTQYYSYGQYPYSAYGGYYYAANTATNTTAAGATGGAYYAAPYAQTAATTTATTATEHPYAAYYRQQGYYAAPTTQPQQRQQPQPQQYVGYDQSTGTAVTVARNANGQYQTYPMVQQPQVAATAAAASYTAGVAASSTQQAAQPEDDAFASAYRPNLQEQEQEFQEARHALQGRGTYALHGGRTAGEDDDSDSDDDSALNSTSKPSSPTSSMKKRQRRDQDEEYEYTSSEDEADKDSDSDFEMDAPRGRKRASSSSSKKKESKRKSKSKRSSSKLKSPDRPRRASSGRANYKESEDDDDDDDEEDNGKAARKSRTTSRGRKSRTHNEDDPRKFHKLCKVELEETLRRLHKKSHALQIPWYNKQDQCMHFHPKYMFWSRLPRGYAIDNEANTLEMLVQWMCPDEDRQIAPLRCLTELDDFQVIKDGIPWFRQLAQFMRMFEMDHCLSLVDASGGFLLRSATPPTPKEVWAWYDEAHTKVFAPLLKKQMLKEKTGATRSLRRRSGRGTKGDDRKSEDVIDGWENLNNFCHMPWIKVFHLLKEEERTATGKSKGKANDADEIVNL